MVLSFLLLQTTGVLINCNKTEKLIIAIKEKANIWYKRKKMWLMSACLPPATPGN